MLPSPSVDSTVMLPPSTPASSRAIGSPSPVPWLSREMNGLKIRSWSAREIPWPRSLTATTPSRRLPRAQRRSPSRRGPAKRVLQEIRDYLKHAITVGDDRRGFLERDELVVDLTPARLVCERAVRLLDESAEIDLFGLHDEAVGPKLCEVDDVADQALEPMGLGGNDLERPFDELRLVDDAVTQGIDVAANRGQRRAQLV